MRGFVRLLALAAVCAAPLASAGGAEAATEAGNSCVTNFIAPGNSIVQLARAPGSPLPIASPVDGVITKWKITNGGSKVVAETMKVLRPTANPKAFQVVGESGFGAVLPGPNSFDTRLPVQAGDKFGLYGVEGVIYCQVPPGADKLGFMAGNPTVGMTLLASAESAEFQSPVSVVIEPDADHDGYGDETQDNCPQNPAAHSECPPGAAPFSIGALPQVKKRSVAVLVSANSKASIVVSGTVKLGKGAQVRLRTATKIVEPGQIKPFTLKFPPALRSRLEELKPKQSLKLRVRIAGSDATNRTATKLAAVKLPGRG